MRFDMPVSEKVVSSQSSSDKKKVHDIYILDSSGSMSGSKFNAAVEGIRKSIADGIVNQEVQMITTVCIFGSYHNISYPVVKTQLTNKDHVELKFINGQTALRDAIGKTFELFENSTDNILVKIFTDGDENDSRVYTQPQIAHLIADKKAKGWTITFIGTDQDVKKVVNQFGIDKTNTLSHNNTAEGITAAYETTRSATMSYSKSLRNGDDVRMDFFNNDK